MQAGARGEHPAGEEPLDLVGERDLVDLDEGGRLRRLGRRARVADARRHLQRAELHRLVDHHVEGDGAAGDLVEAGELGDRIVDRRGGGSRRREANACEQRRARARAARCASARASSSRRPRLVVAGHFRTLVGAEDRALRPVGGRSAGQVRQMRFFPGVRLVGVLGRRDVGALVHPAVPAGRDARGLCLAVVDDPAPVALLLAVIAVAEFVVADELAGPPGPEARAERLPVPPGEELQQKIASCTLRRHARALSMNRRRAERAV